MWSHYSCTVPDLLNKISCFYFEETSLGPKNHCTVLIVYILRFFLNICLTNKYVFHDFVATFSDSIKELKISFVPAYKYTKIKFDLNGSM